MKKLAFLFLPSLIFLMSCGTYRAITVNRLEIGMSKTEVGNLFGPPKRILSVALTDKGLQEVLEYQTSNHELYALNFMDNQLVGYEFIGEEVELIPPPPQPIVIVHEEYPPIRPVEPLPSPTPRPDVSPPGRTNPNQSTQPSRQTNTGSVVTNPVNTATPSSSTSQSTGKRRR